MRTSTHGRSTSWTMSLARWVPRSREAMTPEAEVARILVADADPALRGLLAEWLAEEGCRVVDDDPDLIVVDLPLSKPAGTTLVRDRKSVVEGKSVDLGGRRIIKKK